jgi:membrane associated rhomboid family serine protease
VKWLDSLERRFNFVTIPQFPLFLATANGVCYFMAQAQPEFVSRLLLDPTMIRAGEWWRVVTFLFVPPRIHPILLIFWLMLLYQFAQALENAWGEFRFFFFYFFGATVTVLASLFILDGPMGNTSLNTTLFLAFATLFPDYEILLFFFIPLKVKYLAYFTWAVTLVSVVLGGISARVEILSSLANYFLFFGSNLLRSARLRWDVYRNRRRFKD